MNEGIFSLIITFMNVIIVALLLVIRKYQKQMSKIRLEQSLIKNHIDQTVKADDLQDLQNKYDILMKILDNIQEGKEQNKHDKKEKTGQKIS